MDFLGSLVSGASSIIGGILNSNSTTAANEANLNFARDQMFNQLRYRADDATNAQKATGINRLTLLGAPVENLSANQVGDTSMGAGIAGAGQDIGRALNAYAEKNDRTADLKNKLLEAQIANVNSDTVRNQMAASKQVVQAPTAPTPLYQTFKDPWGNEVRLPSGKASSSLQNVASWPSNLAIGAQMLYHNLFGWDDSHGYGGSRGDVGRYVVQPTGPMIGPGYE